MKVRTNPHFFFVHEIYNLVNSQHFNRRSLYHLLGAPIRIQIRPCKFRGQKKRDFRPLLLKYLYVLSRHPIIGIPTIPHSSTGTVPNLDNTIFTFQSTFGSLIDRDTTYNTNEVLENHLIIQKLVCVLRLDIFGLTLKVDGEIERDIFSL